MKLRARITVPERREEERPPSLFRGPLNFLALLVAVLYVAFGVGCLVAAWRWSVPWTVVGLLVFAGWKWRSRP